MKSKVNILFFLKIRFTCLVFVPFLLVFSGCATVPVTQRKQFSFIPQQQLIALSDDSYAEILKESKLSTDSEKIDLVKRVGKKVADAAENFMCSIGQEDDIKDYKWEFTLIEDDKTANAFCMPGGKIAVYTGILTVTQNESGLATVISHEVAHAIANHGGERLSQLLLVQLGEITLSLALQEKPKETRRIAYIAYGVTANVGVLLPYSRTHEKEADRIGLILMAKAGYDPHEALRFWRRMKEEEKGKFRPPEFLSTHPVPENRIKDIEKNIPEAMAYYRK